MITFKYKRIKIVTIDSHKLLDKAIEQIIENNEKWQIFFVFNFDFEKFRFSMEKFCAQKYKTVLKTEQISLMNSWLECHEIK